jgi:hypothetical protein
MINNLFPGILSTTFSPKIAKNYLRDQMNSFACVWHVLRRRELETSTPEGFEMLTTLLFQKMQCRLRARHRPIISNFGHRIRQKFELVVQPLDETPNGICNFELLGFVTETF